MKKAIVAANVILLLCVLAFSGCRESQRYNTSSSVDDGSVRNVILIGWDGAQRNHMKEALRRKELPNLVKLSNEGSLVAVDILRTTDTKSGWAQILTGYEPEKTGVFSNSRFGPIPKGYTVFERLEEHFGAEKFVTVAVIGKNVHVGGGGPVRKRWDKMKPEVRRKQRKSGELVTEDGVKYLVIPAKPYYQTKESMDVFINGLTEDEKVGKKALELLGHYRDKPFFFFVHFAEVDHQGHKFGENSKEYNDALISADSWTGKIMKKLKELGLYEQTLIYVTADHGFDEGQKGHKDAPYVFLGTNDAKVVRRGERGDITPTILERFGLDLNRIDPPLDGTPLTRKNKKDLW